MRKSKADILGIPDMKVGDVIRSKENPYDDALNWGKRKGEKRKYKSVKNVYGVYEMIRTE